MNETSIETLRAVNEQLSERLRVAQTRIEELELESSRLQLFAKIFFGSPDAMVLANDTGHYLEANQAACELFGLARDGLIGRAVSEFAGQTYDTRSEWGTFRRDNFMAGTFPLRRANGELRLLDFAAVTNIVPGQHLSVLRDVTERNSKARMNEELLGWVVRSSQDAIISEDLEGTVTSWNKAAEELFGFSVEDAVGRNIRMLIPSERHHEEVESLRRISEGSSVAPFETVRLKKDGQTFEAEVSLSPIKNHEGRVIGASKIARDVSARRRSEAALRKIEDQLRHSQKMEAVGQLAGGVAHDFNNLLTVILSYSEIVLQSSNGMQQFRPDVEEIADAARRAAELTRQLLAFGRRQVMQPITLDLNEVVSRLERMLGRLIGENIRLHCDLAQDPGLVRVDESQLEQVIVNLIVNARDAMPQGGTLTVKTKAVMLDLDSASQHLGVVPGPYVELVVSDTGVGMSPETQERIFEPFFTTKEQGKGKGLGLSTVFGIVKQSGGHIWVYSELGQGTAFKVYLPRLDETAVAVAQPESADVERSLQGTERVLLVEDDPQVRKVGCAVLRRSGYTVLEAACAADALELLEQTTGHIDLLLTDVMMPGMTGRELATTLLARLPHLRVLYVSGYTEDAIVHNGVLDPGIEFLPKPVTPHTLLKKVRSVLNSDLKKAV